MPTDLLNFPVGLVVDGITSFIQHRFSKPEITPPQYRWSSDDAQSRIRISAIYSIDNSKPGSIPSITVRRTSLSFASAGINNLAKADANVLTNAMYEDWMDGGIDILCEAGAASEASSLANYLAIEFQANRHSMKEVLPFLRHLEYMEIGPEMMAEQNVEPRRWQVYLRLKISVYIGWIKREGSIDKFNKFSLTDISPNNTWKSDEGIITKNEPYIKDNTADFGILKINNPQLLSAELNQKWYYVLIGDDQRLYTIEEIINNHQLRLSDKDQNDIVVPYNPSESFTTNYRIVWNTIHLRVEISAKKSS
jgi:hypothetical protein